MTDRANGKNLTFPGYEHWSEYLSLAVVWEYFDELILMSMDDWANGKNLTFPGYEHWPEYLSLAVVWEYVDEFYHDDLLALRWDND